MSLQAYQLTLWAVSMLCFLMSFIAVSTDNEQCFTASAILIVATIVLTLVGMFYFNA